MAWCGERRELAAGSHGGWRGAARGSTRALTRGASAARLCLQPPPRRAHTHVNRLPSLRGLLGNSNATMRFRLAYSSSFLPPLRTVHIENGISAVFGK